MNGLGRIADLTVNFTRNGSENSTLDMSISVADIYMDKVMRYINLYLSIIVISILCIFAFATNIVNIVVLVKQKVRSCVSLCLLCLSVTDFFSTFAGLCTAPAKLMTYLEITTSPVDPYAIYFVMVYLCAIFYDTSNTLTAFLSLERCLCVSLPLKFKDIFTFRRGAGAIFGIYLLVFGLNMPHFLSSGLEWKTSEQNRTYLGLWLSSDRVAVDFYLNITVHFCLTIFNMLTVCVCTQIMLVSLNRSSKFQNRKATNRTSFSRDGPDASEETQSEELKVYSAVKDRSESGPKRKSDKVFSKDKNEKLREKDSLPLQSAKRIGSANSLRQKTVNNAISSSRNVNVMKTVILLCVICFLANLTRLTASISTYIEPKLRLGGEYSHWFRISLSIAHVFQLLNCSLNIFVYYRFNRSFRTTFHQVFCCRAAT
ncbi:chemosensory receptor c [Plakobranchus ocellatus]|uniref:Chemosensory receptor c n=1 Tax=Plakobranchus ocellatus TaxID=259542 RepID=A0AAV4CPW1_9GAST|nr:chemosensory receptor c [Plakobranchus ocellatus]